MSKAMIVYNPDSGEGQSKQLADSLNEKIRHQFDTITMQETASGSDVTKYSEQAAKEDYSALFLLGGDGTVNLAVSGLMHLNYSPTIGVIPTGTINNFARMLNIPAEPDRAVEALVLAEEEQIDIGKFNDGYFISTVSAGKIPEEARNVSSEDKERLGPIAYVKDGLDALNNEETTRIKLTLDDDEVVEEDFSLILATTGNSVFGWHNFFPDASLQDGKINVMGLRKSDANEKISLVPEILSDSGDYSGLLYSGVAERLKVELVEQDKLETTVDGNQGPDFPGELSIAGTLPFFVMQENEENDSPFKNFRSQL